jgi:hypothetical protein
MAVINDPTLAANVMQVGMGAGTVWMPSHVSSGPLPVGTGGAFRLSMQSGTMAVSLGANSEIFQFRFVTAASRVCLVHGVAISAGPNVAASAAILAAVRMTLARAWTAAGSGGTRATLTTNNQKLRTIHATSEVNDIGISTTGALTAGTKTLDSQDVGSIAFGIGTGAITTQVGLQWIPKTNLFGEFLGGLSFPLVLANQEGFVIRTGANAFPAGATWTFGVDVAWSEVQGF